MISADLSIWGWAIFLVVMFFPFEIYFALI
jgi:hypothetical protein